VDPGLVVAGGGLAVGAGGTLVVLFGVGVELGVGVVVGLVLVVVGAAVLAGVRVGLGVVPVDAAVAVVLGVGVVVGGLEVVAATGVLPPAVFVWCSRVACVITKGRTIASARAPAHSTHGPGPLRRPPGGPVPPGPARAGPGAMLDSFA
jgi:hypothetical protein